MNVWVMVMEVMALGDEYIVGATSHMSQGLGPCNCEGLNSHPKAILVV